MSATDRSTRLALVALLVLVGCPRSNPATAVSSDGPSPPSPRAGYPTAPREPGGDHPRVRFERVTEWRRWKAKGNTPIDAALRGGWIAVTTGSAGFHFGRLDREEIADGDEIRRHAARLGREIRILTRWRADLIGCDTRVGCDRDAFPSAWLKTVPEGHPAAADLRAWQEAGYEIRPERHMDAGWWNRVQAGVPEGRHALPYGDVDRAAKVVHVKRLAADLCSPDYRAWAVDHAVWQVERTRSDGIVMTNKWLFWPAPQVWHDGPDREWLNGGLLTATPYEPGQYERCFADLIRELAQQGVRVMLNTNGLPSRQQWRWMPPDLPPLLLGEQFVWK